MDQKCLAEIKAREQAATPGPWKASTCNYHILLLLDNAGHALLREPEGKYNSDFIAHSRTDIPALIADNAAKDQQIATLEKALKIAAELYNKATGDGWSASDETAEDFIFMAEYPEQAKKQEGDHEKA